MNSRLKLWALALLCALVFSLPLEKAVEIPGVGTISRAVGLVAFAAGAAVVARRGSLRPPNAALLLAAAWVLWSAATWFWSLDPEATLVRSATLAQLLAMTWLVWETGCTAWLMRAYVAGAAVSSICTMARAALNLQTNYRRYATAGFDPNDLGVTLALAVPMAMYLALRTRGWEAWLYRIAAALAIEGILLTASRTALVALCVVFVFPVFTWRAASRLDRMASAGLLLLLVLSAVWLAPPASRQRLATLTTEVSQGNLHGRTRIWKSGLKAFKGHWMGGVGAAAYPEAVRPWLGTHPLPGLQWTAHNTLLSVMVETGPAGAALFGLLLLTLALFAWMAGGAERALWLTMLAVWMAGVSTLTWENRKPTWLMAGLIMTTWAHSWRREEKRR